MRFLGVDIYYGLFYPRAVKHLEIPDFENDLNKFIEYNKLLISLSVAPCSCNSYSGIFTLNIEW